MLLGYLQRGIEIDGSFLKEVAERVVHRNVYEVYLHHLGMLRQHSSHAAIVLK